LAIALPSTLCKTGTGRSPLAPNQANPSRPSLPGDHTLDARNKCYWASPTIFSCHKSSRWMICPQALFHPDSLPCLRALLLGPSQSCPHLPSFLLRLSTHAPPPPPQNQTRTTRYKSIQAPEHQPPLTQPHCTCLPHILPQSYLHSYQDWTSTCRRQIEPPATTPTRNNCSYSFSLPPFATENPQSPTPRRRDTGPTPADDTLRSSYSVLIVPAAPRFGQRILRPPDDLQAEIAPARPPIAYRTSLPNDPSCIRLEQSGRLRYRRSVTGAATTTATAP
jgi:hypothetical protein